MNHREFYRCFENIEIQDLLEETLEEGLANFHPIEMIKYWITVSEVFALLKNHYVDKNVTFRICPLIQFGEESYGAGPFKFNGYLCKIWSEDIECEDDHNILHDEQQIDGLNEKLIAEVKIKERGEVVIFFNEKKVKDVDELDELLNEVDVSLSFDIKKIKTAFNSLENTKPETET